MPDDVTTTRIRRAVAEDAPALEAVQARSSTHWGYAPDFFNWAPGALKIPTSYVMDNPVYLLQSGERILGFYGLTKEDGNLLLDKLFVDIDAIGKGHGRRLWIHAIETARMLGYRDITIGSDPNAASFYQAMGAEWLGAKPTPNPDWTVQMFRFAIPEITIREARIDEAALLHDLTQRSVLYWGYEPEFLEWEPEAIAVTPEFMEKATTWVAEDQGVVRGYYALVNRDGALYLDKLFIEPDRIGTGYGKRLWNHAVATARAAGADVLLIDADPHAAPFYRAMGAQWVGETVTTWPDWKLQHFRFPLQAGA
jgi:GNAT superfamily N-acetyltransferase